MKMKKRSLFKSMFFVMLFTLLGTVLAFAEDAVKIDTGDTTWIMVSTAFVFLMTPGLAFFYGGMVRKKNVLNTLMNSFVIIALISVQWVLMGYTIAFGPSINGFFGDFSLLGLSGVDMLAPNTDYAATIPHMLFMAFQMMFAIITAALITGAFAERMKFSVMIIFVLLWSTLVYDPLAHWVWNIKGWLGMGGIGALDFAGGNVVHISSGIAGIVAAIVLGKRKGHGTVQMLPHNVPYVVLGAGLLWFGWFGFNAGSALGANGLAVSAFVTTNTAAAAATLSWVILEWIRHGKPTLLGAATGAVVGLVAITPGAGFVSVKAALVIGFVVSPLCYYGISVLKAKFGYDDALDAFGCHGIGGIWGGIATGIFASSNVNGLVKNSGLFYSHDFTQLGVQLVSIAVTIAYSGIVTFLILKGISMFTSLRVSKAEEEAGLDYSLHGETAYR
ncbi:MAG: ammonium transporter, partial [Hyphomonadaceae bacterium]|nr:ammonium transporter [Clostridia bacterium]